MREHYEYESKKIIELYKGMMTQIEKEIAAARAQGLDDTDEYVQELQSKYMSYANAIKDIEDDLANNAKSTTDKLIDIRINMIKQGLEAEKDAIKEKLNYLKDFYDKQKDMLKEAIEEEDYLREQSEKRRAIADIQAELAQLAYDDSAWAQKRKLELAEELSKAQQELDDFERDHALEVAQDELDALYEKQEEELNAQNELLEEKLNDAKAIYEQALADIKNGSVELYEQMIEWNATYGDGIDQTITDAWEAAYEALDKYYALYGKVYEGFKLANATGYQRPTDTWDNEIISGTNPNNKPSSGSSGGSSGGGNSSGSGSNSGGSNQSGSSSSPKVTDAIKRKVAAAIWNGGYGWGSGSERASKLKEVFGPNNGIQAMVNRGVGKHDTPPGQDYTYLKMRKTYKGYMFGTRKAVRGLHKLDELGTETIFESADGAKYKMFTGGEKVLTAKASSFLYDFANSGGKILDKIVSAMFGNQYSNDVIRPGTNVEVHMGDINISGNATRETVSEIRRAQRDAVENMLKEFNRLSRKHA